MKNLWLKIIVVRDFVIKFIEFLVIVIFNYRFFNVKLVGEYGDIFIGGFKG